MNKYICQCCGGRINPTTMKCEYCGIEYKKEADKIIRIETFTNPVRTFSAKVAISDNWFRQFGVESVSKLAVELLVKELSENIAPMMEVYSDHDMATMQHTFSGRIKIIQPVNSDIIGGIE